MLSQHVITRHDLSLASAQALVARGLDLGAQRKVNIAIAIVDRAGHLLAFARMDEAAPVTIEVAIGKARTAAYLKAPSKVFEDMINAGQPALSTAPGLVPLQGGIPLIVGGEIVGAIGISGSSGEGDQAIAMLISEAL